MAEEKNGTKQAMEWFMPHVWDDAFREAHPELFAEFARVKFGLQQQPKMPRYLASLYASWVKRTAKDAEVVGANSAYYYSGPLPEQPEFSADNESALEEASWVSSDLVETCVTPEFDTVRIYFDCRTFVDLNALMRKVSQKAVMSFQRDPITGELFPTWEKYNANMRNSWWSKMTVTKERYSYGQSASEGFDVLSFEFSVAKWYGLSNAFNRGVPASLIDVFEPCCQAMWAMKIDEYSSVSLKQIFQEFYNRAMLRRFDLSINFKLPGSVSVSEVVDCLRRVYLNKSAGKFYDGAKDRAGAANSMESCTWGGAESPYRVTFYDKYKEQKKNFCKFEYDNSDEIRYIKKEFWDQNKDKLENTLRFEVQFKEKFFRNKNLDNVGFNAMENVIDIGVLQWRKILNHFAEALKMTNFVPNEDGTSLDFALNILEKKQQSKEISYTVFCNTTAFMLDCYKYGVAEVKKKMSKDLFSKKKAQVKRLCNFDVCVEDYRSFT